MLKITAIVSLVLIGGTMWAASLSCDSCGSECMSACGTRHFRSCCFNYLRKKRTQDSIRFWTPAPQDNNIKENQLEKIPYYIVKNLPEAWYTGLSSSDLKPYPFEDTPDNRLQVDFDA